MHDLIVLKAPERVVVIEAGNQAGWVKDLCEALGVPIEVANPNHEAWRWKNVKRKTDRDDALKPAKLSAVGQLPTVRLPDAATRQWRALIAYRGRSRQGRITGAGQKLLRALLVEVSWMMKQNNPALHGIAERTARGSKTRRKIAVVALARRLLVICWAMPRDRTDWREPAAAAA